MTQDELIAWARREGTRLASRVESGSMDLANAATADVAAGIDFLARQAPESHWSSSARDAPRDFAYAADLRQHVAELLEAWATYVEAGLASALPFEIQARIVAATDLMEQVQRLLDDRTTHPAAPVVLAGAALEEALRSLLPLGEALGGKPGLDRYGAKLKELGLIGASDAKQITAWAGQRNEAAHGQFDGINRERAQIMIDGINLFLMQHQRKS